MKKSFAIGMLILIISAVSSFILKDMSILMKVTGTVGIVSFLLGGVFTGVYSSGNSIRANYLDEEDNRKFRDKCATSLFFIGLPNIVAATILLLTNKG